MSLPWFKFDVKAFLTDTLRLSTEEKGAYLMLMLDFYEQEAPPPDDDEILARIAGIPAERWPRVRRALETKFHIHDGYWQHGYIMEQLADGQRRYQRTLNATDAANAARGAGKKPPRKPTPTVTETVTDTPTAKSDVTETVTIPVRQPRRSVEEQEQRQEDSANAESGERASDEVVISVIGRYETILREDFKLATSDLIQCASEGYTTEVVSQVFGSFMRYNLAAGTMSQDWTAAWWRWWERKKPPLHPAEKAAAKPKPPKPRIEVSNKAKRPIPKDWTVTEALAAYATQNGQDPVRVEEIFRDYCASNNKLYADHDAAFRTFVRNQANFDRQRGSTHGQAPHRPASTRRAPAPGGSIVEAGDRALAELDRRIAAAEAAESGDGGGPAPVRELPESGLREAGDGAGDDGDGAERLPAPGGGEGDET